MTAKLWLDMLERIQQQYVLSAIDFKLMQKLAKTPKHAVQKLFEKSQPGERVF
jgi:DNA polymerase-3 subunit epsilon